jgi:hypothetical protein
MKDIIVEALSLLKVSDDKRKILEYRYIELQRLARSRSLKYSFYFNWGKMCIVVGTILTPALLSITYVLDTEIIFWITWTLSLIVSILNGFFSLYKVDKNYYTSNICVEQFCSEFWQYISLTGRYSGFNDHAETPSHENQYVYFTNAIEKLHMRSIESSYGQISENLQQIKGTQTVIPPSVFKSTLEEAKKEYPIIDLQAGIIPRSTILELNSIPTSRDA